MNTRPSAAADTTEILSFARRLPTATGRVKRPLLGLCTTLALVSIAGVSAPAAEIHFHAPEADARLGILDEHGINAVSITVVNPGGGEMWEAGSVQPILWAQVELTGDVTIEYSTDGALTWKTITDATPGPAGFYNWTVPNDPSTNALVRVTSNVDPSVSDVNDEPFAIVGAFAFEDSYAWVQPVNAQSGQTVTYTAMLFEANTAALTLTDTLPGSLALVTQSLSVTPGWKNQAQFDRGTILWSDVVTRSVPVAISFAARVTDTSSTITIVNPVRVSRNGADPLALDVLSFVNGFDLYLPTLVR